MSVASTAGFEVLTDPASVAQRMARWMTALALAKDGIFAVALSGGSTPRKLYETLAGPDFRDDFPWPRVQWFWGDERFVPPEDSMSNYRMAWETMLSRVPVSPSRIHAIATEGVTPDGAALRYERELRSFYGAQSLDPARPLFDLVLLGLGTDGHTASLFPGSAALAECERWAAATELGSQARITLTYPALQSSAHAVFMVTGADKRDILAKLRRGDAALPAARLRPIGELHYFVDAAAAGT